MQQRRRELFYEALVNTNAYEPAEWLDKWLIAELVNVAYSREVGHFAKLYELNDSPTAHDVCSLMNSDRIAINESLAFEKIILVKDNKFKIATRQEAIAEEERIHAKAINDLWRGSLLRAKRLQDGQIITDFEKNAQLVIETFGGNDGQKH